MSQDLYQVLGVPKDASTDAIKKAFRKLAKQHHPDRNPGDAKAEARFKEINRAFEVLSDPDKRKLYDEFGEESLRAGFDPNLARAARAGFGRGAGGAGFAPEDLFEQLFRQAGRGRTARGRAPRGFTGFEGFEGFSGFQGFDDVEPGPAVRRADLAIDFRTAALGGERELRFSDGRALQVRIPPGVRDGETIKIPQHHLHLTVHVSPHPVFERDGEDLHVHVPITVVEAVRGGAIQVPTLEGTVTVKVPPGTQTGRKLRVRGKGIQRRGRPAGDLYAHVEVRVPEHLDDETLGALERAYAGDVRGELHRRAAA